MRPGDLVKFRDPWSPNAMMSDDVGLVVSVEPWVDKGAPDRNFGVNVHVLWSNGDKLTYEECELELIT